MVSPLVSTVEARIRETLEKVGIRDIKAITPDADSPLHFVVEVERYYSTEHLNSIARRTPLVVDERTPFKLVVTVPPSWLDEKQPGDALPENPDVDENDPAPAVTATIIDVPPIAPDDTEELQSLWENVYATPPGEPHPANPLTETFTVTGIKSAPPQIATPTLEEAAAFTLPESTVIAALRETIARQAAHIGVLEDDLFIARMERNTLSDVLHDERQQSAMAMRKEFCTKRAITDSEMGDLIAQGWAIQHMQFDDLGKLNTVWVRECPVAPPPPAQRAAVEQAVPVDAPAATPYDVDANFPAHPVDAFAHADLASYIRAHADRFPIGATMLDHGIDAVRDHLDQQALAAGRARLQSAAATTPPRPFALLIGGN